MTFCVWFLSLKHDIFDVHPVAQRLLDKTSSLGLQDTELFVSLLP